MKIKKFIINKGQLVIGEVEFHKHLIGRRNKQDTIGGGRWEIGECEHKGKVFFFGESTDFGAVTEQQFIDAWKDTVKIPMPIKKCEYIFSTQEYYSGVLREMENKKPPYIVGTEIHKDMKIEDINKEIEEMRNIEQTRPSLIAFAFVDRAQELADEIMYRKEYEPKGISRFDAGRDMFNRGL